MCRTIKRPGIHDSDVIIERSAKIAIGLAEI